MKISIRKTVAEAGNVMLVTLIMCFIMGTTLASYLIMVNNQNLSVVRSQTWNGAIPVGEAGVEEALAFVNKYAGNSETNKLEQWADQTSADADGWSLYAYSPEGYKIFARQREIPGGRYTVFITNNPTKPYIRSIGSVAWNQSYQMVAPVSASIGTTYTADQRLRRNLAVETKRDAIWAVAMAARYVIDFNGRNVATDSFDSSDPNFSNGGLYPLGDLSKTKDNGDVVTSHTIINSMNVGNAKIKGQVKTGPEGTISIGNGSVGDKAWVEGGNIGIKPGYAADDMNVVFPDATIPPSPTGWLPAVANNLVINGKLYQYAFLNSGDYTISSVSGAIYVGTNANVRLRIYGNVSLAGGNDEIYIAPVQASLKVYMLGSTFRLTGNGLINPSGNALNFQYFGLPTNTSIQFGGNGDFIGAIYAPQASFSLGGGGNDVFDFIGASVTLNVQMNGHYNFHYDEALKLNGPARGFVPTSWRES
jgi:hypothetical protein